MLKTMLLTFLALVAFAANSVLCRLALNDNIIDAASFTSIRLLSGAIFLLFLVYVKTKKTLAMKAGTWKNAFYLFIYAVAFSYAYISLDTGAGALILFGSVQTTMIIFNFMKGQKLSIFEWAGLIVALSGLLVLLLPGASAPSLSGFIIMTLSGIAWGLYTLAGRGATSPVANTASNFVRTIPFILVLTIFTFDSTQTSNEGIMLAILSGAIMSGLGYAIWYSALTHLSITQASTLQLIVPIMAAFGGVIFLNELITTQLVISSALVLGGVLVVTLCKPKKSVSTS